VSHVVVPCYHAVSADWPADLSVTPENFKGQLELFTRRGYGAATFSEALEGTAGPKVVAITFDDAFRSVFDIAFPLMQAMGLVGTVFVPTAWPGRDEPMKWDGIDRWLRGPYEEELACMSWDQLRALADAGWEIGAHTHSHPHLTDVDDARLAEELRRSRQVMEEQMGAPCVSLAYPYGDADARVVAAAEAAGYDYGATMKASIPEPEPLWWPRVGIYHRDQAWRWRLKLSPSVARMRMSRFGDAVDRARGV
jgi:peptidoglycan/xylan/chitin deacetylase (PgdA/CDA1 family)